MILKKILLSVLIFSSVQASVFKLADAFISESAVKGLISSSGAKGASLSKMNQYISTSINSLLKKGDGDLYRTLVKLRVEKGDQVKKIGLVRLLKKDINSLSNQEFVSAVNDLIYLSNKYGAYRKRSLTCSLCIGEELNLIGYKTSIKVYDQGNTTLSSTLAKLPKGSRQLRDMNMTNLQILGAKDTTRYLKKDDERAFGLFLELSRNGNKAQRDFGKAVLNFNKNSSGLAVLNGPGAPSNLWRLASSDLSREKLAKFTSMLEVAAKQSNPSARKEVLFDQLFKEAGNDPDEIASVRKLKSNNCFFNK